MKTYPLRDANGFEFGFEIENAYIGLRTIAKLLSTITGVTNISKRRLFEYSKSDLITFNYLGQHFLVSEPYGDNSRYWICPKDISKDRIEVTGIKTVFSVYQPSWLVKLIGDTITLKFLPKVKRQGD